MKKLNDKLRALENDADRLMLDLCVIQNLGSGPTGSRVTPEPERSWQQGYIRERGINSPNSGRLRRHRRFALAREGRGPIQPALGK